MISNQILQNTIDNIKSVSNVDLTVLDAEGKLILTTDQTQRESDNKDARSFALSQADTSTVGEYQFFKVMEDNSLAYILMIKSESPDAFLVGKLAVIQIHGLLAAYKERFDKDNFIKNLLLDNLLLVDIYNRAKRLHIDVEKRRLVFIVESSPDKDKGTLENIRLTFADNGRDFVTAVDETSIIIVKELEDGQGYAEAKKTAEEIRDVIGQDSAMMTRIAFGTIVKEIKDVSRSYKEARMALDVGKIFSPEEDIVAYSSLGIGRLIYQLPIPLCRLFIKEIFSTNTPDTFDEETLITINKFFENNLNVSETARQLFIHRNTLVYRLDKLQKNTGLDLRIFEDAIIFKIALMVVRHMKYVEDMEY